MSEPIWPYWRTTELTPDKDCEQDPEMGRVGERDYMRDTRKAALDRAHEIRKFEIELYWKRATYFWVLQAAVFTALGLTWRYSDAHLSPLVPTALAALGFVTAFAGWLSARGSKFWQENWEFHIDMLEDKFEGRLHKTAYVGVDGIQWSVSGVNDRLALAFVVFWISVFVASAFVAVPGLFGWVPGWWLSDEFQLGLICAAAIGVAILLYRRTTRFAGGRGVSFEEPVPVFEGTDWIDPDKLPSIAELAKLKQPFLVRREAKVPALNRSAAQEKHVAGEEGGV